MGRIKRRFARFSDLEVINNVFIEGGIKGYSGWEIYSRFAPGLLASEDNFLCIRDDGKGLWYYDATNTTYIIEKDSGIIATYVNRLIFPTYFPVSTFGRYAMSIDFAEEFITIQDAEIEVWRPDFVADSGAYVLDDPPLAGIWTCAMSPRAEWLVFELIEAVSLNALLFFYRGVKA